jgi:hypothetical protein
MPGSMQPRGERNGEPEDLPPRRAPAAVYIFAYISVRVAEEQPEWPQIAEHEFQHLGPDGFGRRTVQGALAVLEESEMIVRQAAYNEHGQRRADRYNLGPAVTGGPLDRAPPGTQHAAKPRRPPRLHEVGEKDASRPSPPHSTRNGPGAQHPAPQKAKIEPSSGVAAPDPVHEEQEEQP